MRKPTLLAAVISLSACSPEALQAMHQRTEAGLNELSHAVRVRFEDGAALLKVSRKIRNDTLEYQVVGREIGLPTGAIATSFSVSTDDAWPVQSTLTSNEEANARWEELIAPGLAAPSPVGKLEWSWNGNLQLDLFGLAPGATVNVEYDLELPPDYAAGELSFEYPRDDESQVTPSFQLASGTLERATSAESDADEDVTEYGFRVRQQKHIDDSIAGRWATYPLEVDRSIWRLELDVAAQLGELPVRPNVVFVVDGSHSEGPEGIAAQLELIEPYLANARDAQVEIVIYRRFAERVFGRFVPAGDVARLLASVAPDRLAPANGSNLELGARLAAESLAQVGGLGRVVLFTDESLRFGFENALAIEAFAAAPRETVVHLVARYPTSGSELSESRDDTAELSGIASAWGGMFVRVDGHPTHPVLSADTLLGLVRPVRIDSMAIEAQGLEETLALDSQLPEGSTVRQMAVGAPPEEVVVTGKIWAREIRRVLKVDRALANRLPGLSIGDEDTRTALSDEELKTVAYVSHAVSPVTSFFAAAPGAAASTAGVYTDVGGTGFGSLCGCGGGESNCGGWGKAGTYIDFASILRRELAPAIASCAARGEVSQASLELEATGDEVVAVKVTAPSSELGDCLTEAIWAVRLSSTFVAHRTYELSSL